MTDEIERLAMLMPVQIRNHNEAREAAQHIIAAGWRGPGAFEALQKEHLAAHQVSLDTVRQLEARLAGAWQPIETAPRDGTEIDLWCINSSTLTTGGGRIVDCHFHCGDWLRWSGDPETGYARIRNATHWRPPPAPPGEPPAPQPVSDAEVEALRAALDDAGHYVAICPPPSEATGKLRVDLLECRVRIAEAAAKVRASDD